ncbi:hypothetical protein T231_11330 [Tannerella sp. oral taxon BU063 isolate Cell 6/7/9]|uniref:Uncharacterized protein n=1 Tax=Tannerella sp. oral taxon BU063 isolate Cell 6/7/9 TaxID=1411021 RepID=W2CRA6_9BACT|nr:hypothetical protein T231_11330 [Tannerella sp. oral taxon BU063 isolate Cell 6/7/9]
MDRSPLISELHSEVGRRTIAALKVLQHTLTIDMEMALVGSTGADFDYTHVMVLEISQCRRGCCCRYSIGMDLCHSRGKQIVSMHTEYGTFGTVIWLLSGRNGMVVMERNGIVRILDHAWQAGKVLEVARGRLQQDIIVVSDREMGLSIKYIPCIYRILIQTDHIGLKEPICT